MESTVDDLVAQFGALETGNANTLKLVNVWYKKYMLYIALFVWTLLLVIVARPSTMYVIDPETKERRLKFGKVMITVLVIYATLVGLILGVDYFKKRYA